MEHFNKIGTTGGTLLAIVTAMPVNLAQTALVAATGAISSFFVSLLLKNLHKKFTNKKPKQ